MSIVAIVIISAKPARLVCRHHPPLVYEQPYYTNLLLLMIKQPDRWNIGACVKIH